MYISSNLCSMIISNDIYRRWHTALRSELFSSPVALQLPNRCSGLPDGFNGDDYRILYAYMYKIFVYGYIYYMVIRYIALYIYIHFDIYVFLIWFYYSMVIEIICDFDNMTICESLSDKILDFRIGFMAIDSTIRLRLKEEYWLKHVWNMDRWGDINQQQ